MSAQCNHSSWFWCEITEAWHCKTCDTKIHTQPSFNGQYLPDLIKAKDEIEKARAVIKDMKEALEAYDFGLGTIGHDTLNKHREALEELLE